MDPSFEITELILGLCRANERRRYFVTNNVPHWLGTNLESALNDLVCLAYRMQVITEDYKNVQWKQGPVNNM